MASNPKRRPPRQHSAASRSNVLNITEPMPGQTDWSVDNLPEILYVFRPTAPQVRSHNKMPMKPSPWDSGQDLRIFDILPDRISANVEEFRVEAWMRLDRRIQLHDITDRMHPEFRIAKNALQQRGVRFRQAFSILSWGSGNKQTQVVAEQLEKEMEARGIDPALNSTRGLTPGLINLALGEAGGRIPVPEAYKQRFQAFAKEQQELIQQLPTMDTPVVVAHTLRTQEAQQLFIDLPVESPDHMQDVLPGLELPTNPPSQLISYDILDDNVYHDRTSQEPMEQRDAKPQNSDGICANFSQDACSVQEEGNVVCPETTAPDASNGVHFPLENSPCPGIPCYGDPLEIKEEPPTPTKVRVSRVPIELLMQQYVDIPYCWKLEMFEAMHKIHAVMAPITHPDDPLQGEMVADEWELFPTIPNVPFDYLDFGDSRDQPIEYEKMEGATKYQREYDIDMDYCEQLRASCGLNFA
ncbi:hypothetical protein I7I51_08991 [Histoplasma capsulatum]|uniref:Uncharacterized protein n=1 Tax=Ajellomyces capsulatus TaxID=5037 RepID=A0A8A1M1U7_AJECA|nr:predicted protein [Histoplasma mississippiense (nom. inval.)]EDN04711.1 predicted protein [Histoplasma mississippiense (nom. inval.)]QSS59555.1 hypothetical protein I7I51_08991 [Histoplasma capsulatum]